MLLSLQHWYRVEVLLPQVQILVVPRPGTPVSPAVLEPLQQRGATLAIADFMGPDVSSSDYRATGNPAAVPVAVASYIKQQALYGSGTHASTPAHASQSLPKLKS